MNAQPAPCGDVGIGPDAPCTLPNQHRGDHAHVADSQRTVDTIDGAMVVYPGRVLTWPRTKTTRRGTSNSDKRGSSYDRRARRARLVDRFRADRDLLAIRQHDQDGNPVPPYLIAADPCEDPEVALELLVESSRYVTAALVVPAARCYACGALLHAGFTWPGDLDSEAVEGTLTCDRIIPAAEGGTYVDTNLRPACARHNSSTGGALGVARKMARKAARQAPQDVPAGR